MYYDIYNGDADGICSLIQLRLSTPRESTLVTGVKRDIDLVKRINAASGDHLTVLDISMDKNRTGLTQALENGATVEYFDHHFAGDIPQHPNLKARIDTAAEVCTALLVDKHLNGKYRAWAVVAAFGDNLHQSAADAAAPLALKDGELAQLEELGTLMNYNGYGATVEDLYFDPAELYRRAVSYQQPLDFIASDDAYATLRNGYASDMANARAIAATIDTPQCATFEFPLQSWSRRVGGVYGNELAREYPDRAHALLSAIDNDAFQVSVRAPLNRRDGADDLCRQFETGGGRKAAAGINRLPAADVEKFNQAFISQYG